MYRLILFLMTLTSAQIAFSQAQNPFFSEWKTPFQVPPFDQIKNSHYMPAFTEAMDQQKKEIEKIIKSSDVPDFSNTVVALDQSGALLDQVSAVFSGLNGANTDVEMQDIARKLSPLLTCHNDDINLNPELFRKINVVYEKRESLGLEPDQLRLVEETYKNFVRGGAKLNADDQKKLRDLNERINMLQLTFGQNLLAETNAYKLVIDRKEDLAGLPESLIQAAAEAGNKEDSTRGKWVFTLQNPSVMPFLQYASRRSLRQEIFTAYLNRCNHNNEFDNKPVIEKLVALRAEKARLMGFDNFASFMLENRMAGKPEEVYQLLDKIWTPAQKRANEELAGMEPLLKQETGDSIFESWDWRYYSEKLMKQKFSLEEADLKPYFQLENVREGVFYVANKLYGITFREVKNAPKYDPAVSLYECRDADGSHLGVLYFDFHPRKGKRGGAWCGTYRSQGYKDGKRVAPVVTIVCNFTSPTKDTPALLTADETSTLFHEFGHALHNLLKNVRYKGLASTPRDFVELPSQIMEHWAFEPAVLKVYARHYRTNQVMPQTLVEKINQSEKYGQGFKTTEYLAASYLDMDYHMLKVPAKVETARFEQQSMSKIRLIPQIPPRYRSTYFQHSMTGGYTAGYYSYIWAEVLDADAYEAFRETGDIFNAYVASLFRKEILEKGGSVDAKTMYRNFRGKDPGIYPLLFNRGLY